MDQKIVELAPANQDIIDHQNMLLENNLKFNKFLEEFEADLKRLYALKAEEIALNLRFETWKALHQRQQAELKAKRDAVLGSRQDTNRSREAFCADVTRFAKEFSLEASLARMRSSEVPGGFDLVENPSSIVEAQSPISVRLVEVDREIELLRQKEAELDQRERELAPDECTIGRLQEAVRMSSECVEQMEQEIANIQLNNEHQEGVRPILKRPSFMGNDPNQKQVRFE